MYDSFQAINDVENIEKVDTYSKLMNFIKKFNPFMTGILMNLNSTRTVNFRGSGYEINANQSANLAGN